MKYICSSLLAITSFFVIAAQNTSSPNLTEQNLKKHISFLADDKLEGRRAGTAGEQKAMEYIANQFESIGLLKKGVDGYYQPFEIKDGKKMADDVTLSLNKKNLHPEKDFFILPFSSNGKYVHSGAVNGKGQPWLIDINSTIASGVGNPHFDVWGSLRTLAEDATAKGANAVFFYNSANEAEDLKFNKKDKSAAMSIPLVYLNKNVANGIISNNKKIKIKLLSDVVESNRTGHNVIGYVDNNAANTVVIGAHFDHLGYGEDGNSMLRTGDKLIHNGADDNASGTAALIEIARLLKNNAAKQNNYLFISFSAEELGLFGSKYYVDNPTINLNAVNYMINLDMVGRLNDSTKSLTIGGYGTSPAWASVVRNSNDFNVKIDSSGAGPSDHTSFYRKGIPVLFYFTGLHQDYHKPSDDYDKINYKGETQIVYSVLHVVEALNNSPKLAFLKTREQQVSNASFKVTLGIMPDYAFSGDGVKADGVTEGRPAAKAGLQAGDIIIGLGSFTINGMDSYMKALNNFKKGETTTVKFKRGNEIKEASLTF